MLKRLTLLILTLFIGVILGGCLSKEEEKFLESVSDKKIAEKKVSTELKKNGINQVVFDKNSKLSYPQTGKFFDKNFVILPYKVEFGLFTYTGSARFSVKKDDSLSIGNLIDNGINGEESSEEFVESFSESVGDEWMHRLLESSQFQELMNKMNLSRAQLEDAFFSSAASEKNISNMIELVLKTRSYSELDNNELQDIIKLIAGSSFLEQEYFFHFDDISSGSLGINERKFLTIMEKSDLPSGEYSFHFKDQTFETTKMSKKETSFIQNKQNTEKAQKLIQKSLEKYSIQENLTFDNEQQLQFFEKIGDVAYDLVSLDYSLKFATFQYDGKAIFHLKEQNSNLQLDEITFNSLDSNTIDEYSLFPISAFFAQSINEEVIKRFNQSKQFSDFMKVIGLKEGDITEKIFYSGELNGNLMGILRIAKEVDSYTDYSTDDLMSFLKVANNNQNISPSYQFTLSIVTSNLTIDSNQLEKIAEKNKFPKGSYRFEFLDKEVTFEIED
jgi:hypothetical protein